MAELVVIGYADVETAGKAFETVQRLQSQGVLRIGGAAVVSRTEGGTAEMVLRTKPPPGDGPEGGHWGLLFGLLFLGPPAVLPGGAAATMMGSLSGWGFRDEFRSQANAVLLPGAAALVLFMPAAMPDKATSALAPLGGEVVRAPLSAEAETEIGHATALSRMDQRT